MSDERLDALAESARNRGLKLVRSRVRTPGKRRFGKVGLTDASGKPIFGMDQKGPAAKPEDVEDYLRNLGAKDWGASLGVAIMPRKRKTNNPARAAANDAEPEPKPAPKALARSRPKPASKPKPAPKPKPPPPPKPKPAPKPKPPPKPQVRDSKPADAPRLVELMKLLGHDTDEKAVRRRIAALAKDRLAPLVAEIGREVVGLCGIHRMVAVHREQPVGRITILVVAEDVRGRGIGRLLADAAEAQLRKLGCRMVEVTSNDRLSRAHAFYRHIGYERTSMRFMKPL